MTMLEAKNVVKTFDGFRALDGTTLTVPRGAVYGLVGPNGAGKSTIIRHLTGVYRPDSGELLLEGVPIYESPSCKRRMAVIPDDWYYFPQATIAEMARYYAGMYPTFDWSRYNRLKEVFPLQERQMIRRMSKGMQKQAAFWLAMSCMPEYLVLDEPVDGLDPVMRRQVWSALLGDVAERGVTVLVSSHNLRELEDVCDHVGIMNKGKVLLERTLSDLQDNTVKLQVVYPGEEPTLPAELRILHHSQVGRVHTYILRGSSAEIQRRMQITQPLLLEAIPLTLEEIFIYEMGGADYAVRDIVL
jgi:ABC-2 type transport system ATP-binding protein